MFLLLLSEQHFICIFDSILGYQLCDNSNGVLFNDCTRLLLYNNNEQIEYIDKDMAESYHTLRSYPETLVKKVTLLKYFRNYMSEHLLKVTYRFSDFLIQAWTIQSNL